MVFQLERGAVLESNAVALNQRGIFLEHCGLGLAGPQPPSPGRSALEDSPHHHMAGHETVADAKRSNSSFPVLPINNLTLGALMSAWIFVIGLVLLWAGMSSRLERRDRRNLELAALNNPIKVAAFWGYDAKAERQAYVDKAAEHSNWRSNVRFQVINWTIFGVGAALCTLGAVLWLGEDRTPTWDRLWDLVGPFVVAAVGIYYVYQLMKRLDKAENEIKWLSLMLNQVKDNGQVSYSELERRLDEFERTSDRG
jgi:hypothetical protein